MHVLKSALAVASLGTVAIASGPAHADRFESWSELVSSGCYSYGATADYDFETTDLDNGLLVMAIHGGNLEPRTKNLAEEVAGSGAGAFASKYVLDVHNKVNWCSIDLGPAFMTKTSDLHVGAEHFDEPIAHTMANANDVIVSIHGMADRHGAGSNFPRYAICVGGQNDDMRDHFIELVRANDDLELIRVIDAVYPQEGGPAENDDGVPITPTADRCLEPVPLGGIHPNNPVNLGSADGGLQLEMSRSLRDALYGLTPEGLMDPPWDDHDAVRAALVEIIREVMLEEDEFGFGWLP